MNKLFLIGNLTRDPELRKTQDGRSVCNFTLAVNRRTNKDHPEADYFRCTAWDGSADNCFKYLAKGRKACVVGEVHLDSYPDRDGVIRYNMNVRAQTVEFLTPKKDDQAAQDEAAGYVQVPEDEVPEF